jgi:hypothetical protein
MALDLLPYSNWAAGTLQNSVPANTNALRSEVLAARVISDTVTAQPGTPADGDCYIIPAGRTGTAWATFAVGSLAYYRGGTWYEFTAYEGLLKVVSAALKLYTSGAWAAYGGGGGGFSNPMTTSGDIIVGGPGGAATRLPIGSEGQVLKVVGGTPSYAPETGGGGEFDILPDARWRGFFMPSSSTFNTLNCPGISSQGTLGFVVPSTDTQYGSQFRTRSLAGSNANSIAAIYPASNFLWRSRGFSISIIGSPTSGLVSTGRFFLGVRNQTGGFSASDVSALSNLVGIGYDSADNNLQLMHNDAGGTATKIDLGALFARGATANTEIYRIDLSCDPSGDISYTVKRLHAPAATVSGVIAANIPLVGTSLAPAVMYQTGGTTAAAEVSIFGCKFSQGTGS